MYVCRYAFAILGRITGSWRLSWATDNYVCIYHRSRNQISSFLKCRSMLSAVTGYAKAYWLCNSQWLQEYLQVQHNLLTRIVRTKSHCRLSSIYLVWIAVYWRSFCALALSVLAPSLSLSISSTELVWAYHRSTTWHWSTKSHSSWLKDNTSQPCSRRRMS